MLMLHAAAMLKWSTPRIQAQTAAQPGGRLFPSPQVLAEPQLDLFEQTRYERLMKRGGATMLARCTKEYHTAITPSTGSFRRCSSTRSGNKRPWSPWNKSVRAVTLSSRAITFVVISL
eukprot:scaffold732_cov60-Phaeocystis_antarctica.AAC.5